MSHLRPALPDSVPELNATLVVPGQQHSSCQKCERTLCVNPAHGPRPPACKQPGRGLDLKILC